MNGRRIDLSATQVIASMAAAVTGAVAASTLGIAGTVVGAAVMSVASTAVAAVYKHCLARSRERLRTAREAARSAPPAGGHFLPHHRAAEAGQGLPQATRPGLSRATTRPDLSRATTRTDLSRASAGRPDRATGPDDETQILPAVTFGQHRWDGADRANGLEGLDDGATQIVSRPGYEGAGAGRDNGAGLPGRPDPGDGDARRGGLADRPGLAGAPGRPRAGDDGDEARQDARWRRPRPLVLAGIALGVFLLAMAGITAFEALAGRPLDAIVGSGHGSGTTVGSIIGGSGRQSAPRHTGPALPSQGPSPTPGASRSPAGAPTPSVAPTPTPTPTPAPSPTPSGSPGASPAASASVPASPARAPASPGSGAGP
jgi:hypothetical protein